MPKSDLFLEQNLDDPRIVSTDPRKARVVRQRDPVPDIPKRPRRRRTSDTSRPTIVHRLRDVRGIVAMARADALHTSIMDTMNAVFDGLLRGIETGRFDRRDRARGFIADTMIQMQIGSPGTLQLIVKPKHDRTELVFWSYPGVVISVQTDLAWDGQHGRRLSSIRCEIHLMVPGAERDRCREFFEHRRAHLQALTFATPTPTQQGGTVDA